MWDQAILHADLDAFYASVEQRDDPSLANKPVAVGMGMVLAASYEARRFGVRAPLNEREARRRCPGLLVVPPRMDAYVEASEAVFKVFADSSPKVEAMSIDEAFIDVTGLQRLVGPPELVAERLRQRVLAEVGLPLSVGVASTKFLAKVASTVSKPNGLRVVEPGAEIEFLHPLPVAALWGVGPKTADRLKARGIRTVADVARIEPQILCDIVGKGAANHLHALSHNRDPRSVVAGRRNRSIGSQRSFPGGGVGRDGAEAILLSVCDGVGNRLRSSHQLARTITLRLRFSDFTSATRSRTLPDPTESTRVVHQTASDLLDIAWATIMERGLTKVGIAVSNLCPDTAVQLSLPFEGDHRLDDGTIDRAVDAARSRFGYDSVTRARLATVDHRPWATRAPTGENYQPDR